MSEPATDPNVKPARQHGEPYCSNCGYLLAGATESARCPECGKPLVDVLVRERSVLAGRSKRFRTESTFLGLPLIDIALGPRHDLNEAYGKARGIIAIGDAARGGIAIGGRAFGVVSVGGLSVGVFSLGGMSIGLGTAVGGGAIGGLAAGGGAIGGAASGGGAFGFIAQGGGAVGYYASGGGAVGKHVLQMGRAGDPEAVRAFDAMSWYFGGNGVTMVFQPGLVNICIMIVAALAIVIVANILKSVARDKGV